LQNPHEVTVDHGDPSELMAEFMAIAEEMAAIQPALKQELIEALGS
jgi:type I restriction enzyme M protein